MLFYINILFLFCSPVGFGLKNKYSRSIPRRKATGGKRYQKELKTNVPVQANGPSYTVEEDDQQHLRRSLRLKIKTVQDLSIGKK